MSEPVAEVTEYRVSVLPWDDEDDEFFLWDIYVRRHGENRWGVHLSFRRCLSREGSWDYEIRPSEREEDWLERHRFPLEEALALARAEAPNLRVNGVSALDHRQRGLDV